MSEREPDAPAGESLPDAGVSDGATRPGSDLPPGREPEAPERAEPAESAASLPAPERAESAEPPASRRAPNMLPGRAGRASEFERVVMRVIATGGVIGIGVAIAAILAANKVQGWIIGLVVATVSVLLSALLWSSRQL